MDSEHNKDPEHDKCPEHNMYSDNNMDPELNIDSKNNMDPENNKDPEYNIDPESSLQDVVRCHLCDTPDPPLHCDICEKNLCKACEKEHLFDRSIEHILVPFDLRGCLSRCQKHSSKICGRYCEQCNIPICERCASKKHSSHEIVDIVKKLESKKPVLQRDLDELQKFLYPKYEEIARQFNFPVLKARVHENTEKLKRSIRKHGDRLYMEIKNIIDKLQSDLDAMDSKQISILKKHEDELKNTCSEINQSIADLKYSLKSNDVSLVSTYESGNAEFRKLPPKITLTLPCFTAQKINKEHIKYQFGSLSSYTIKVEHSYAIDSTLVESSSQDRQLIDIPRLVKEIKTEYRGLCSVSCQSDEQIWTCSQNDKVIRLYNLEGEVVKSIQTKSGKWPWDITVTRNGDLVYADYKDRSVNIMRNNHTDIQTIIRLKGWSPSNICSTASGDLLVVMDSDDNKQTKVVRYSGSTKKQSIQFNNKKTLFSSGDIKYISENKNLDICVADQGGGAVVVVNQAGKFRFRYTGPDSTPKGEFIPHGITTDSEGRILTAVCYIHNCIYNRCIHILDHDGNFQRYIDNCDLEEPFGLCVDSKDNLFVTEWETGKVNKIMYCK